MFYKHIYFSIDAMLKAKNITDIVNIKRKQITSLFGAICWRSFLCPFICFQ